MNFRMHNDDIDELRTDTNFVTNLLESTDEKETVNGRGSRSGKKVNVELFHEDFKLCLDLQYLGQTPNIWRGDVSSPVPCLSLVFKGRSRSPWLRATLTSCRSKTVEVRPGSL